MRPRALLVRETEAPEFMDEEGLRFGIQGVRLPVRARALEERPGLAAAGGRGAGRGGEEAAPADALGARRGRGRRALAGLQPVQLGLLLAALGALGALHQPHARLHARQAQLQDRDRVRPSQVSPASLSAFIIYE